MSMCADDREVLDDVTHCPGKETLKEATNSSWICRPFLKGENALCCFTSKSHLILDTFVPFPPLTSLILTHHLNKEVRAMIKSLSELSCSPNVRPNSASNNRHLFFLLLYHRSPALTLSVPELNRPSRSTFVASSCLVCLLLPVTFLWLVVWRHVTPRSRSFMFENLDVIPCFISGLIQFSQLPFLFFSSSTASVKILGLLPLFAAFDSQVNFAFLSTLFILLLLLRTMERKTLFVCIQLLRQPICWLRRPSLITKAAAVLCDLVNIQMSCNKDFCT